MRKLCKIFPEVVLWSQNQIIFLELELEPLKVILLGARVGAGAIVIFFFPSVLSIILTTLHFLEHSARKALKDAKDHEETGSN